MSFTEARDPLGWELDWAFGKPPLTKEAGSSNKSKKPPSIPSCNVLHQRHINTNISLVFQHSKSTHFLGLYREAYMEYQNLAWNIQPAYFGFPQGWQWINTLVFLQLAFTANYLIKVSFSQVTNSFLLMVPLLKAQWGALAPSNLYKTTLKHLSAARPHCTEQHHRGWPLW